MVKLKTFSSVSTKDRAGGLNKVIYKMCMCLHWICIQSNEEKGYTHHVYSKNILMGSLNSDYIYGDWNIISNINISKG